MMRLGQFRKSWERVNGSFQTGLSGLLLFVGIILFVVALPSALQDILSGGFSALRDLIDIVAGVGLCWLQWRYRHIVYPQLRRDSRRLTHK